LQHCLRAIAESRLPAAYSQCGQVLIGAERHQQLRTGRCAECVESPAHAPIASVPPLAGQSRAEADGHIDGSGMNKMLELAGSLFPEPRRPARPVP
jgi:hypothetical protein